MHDTNDTYHPPYALSYSVQNFTCLYIIKVRQSVSVLPLTSSGADAVATDISKAFSFFAMEHRICFDSAQISD